MLPQNLNDTRENHIQELLGTGEGQRIDFKRDLPQPKDPAGKTEFAKDLCAFANGGGGDLVYGVRDENATAVEIMPLTGEASDAATRRLRSLADGVEPRIVGLQVHPVTVADGYVMVVRVPDSFIGPHRYQSVEGAHRFVIRAGTQTLDLRYEELRSAFDRNATLRERATRFRLDRLGKIVSGQTWGPLPDVPLLAVHLVPLQSSRSTAVIDVAALYERGWEHLRFPGWMPGSRSLNLDGLVAYADQGPDHVRLYLQFFRSGAIEGVRIVARTGAAPGEGRIGGADLAVALQNAVIHFLATARSWGLSGPALVSAALINVGDFTLAHASSNWDGFAKADRGTLILPELEIERLEDENNAELIWRPLLDLLWQSFDLPRCGELDPRRGG